MSWPCGSTAVGDERFFAQHPTAFTVTRSDSWRGPGFSVTNFGGGAAVMQVQTADLGSGNLRSLVLLDAASQAHMVAVEESSLGISGQRKWEAFSCGGTSGTTDRRRLFYAVDSTRFFQLGNTVHVFLDGNFSGERAHDFVVHGSYLRGTMTVSHGGDRGGDFIAQIRKDSSHLATLVGDNTYTVWVNPGVDQAFVLALAVVLDQMYTPNYDPKCCKHN
ncbi:protein LURP-one-related 15-like [Lolium perenne]|uniref:protein LURP-one-related 15-like n=1 Tax=Lolium perenne TaxID=4522 RepID=UPI0021F65CFB|nr:uncharacterized protein LOC127325498 [Lolium perenne]